MMQGSLQHIPAMNADDPMSLYGCSNWDRLIACRDIGVPSKEYISPTRADMDGECFDVLVAWLVKFECVQEACLPSVTLTILPN
jgi:hypothetical protein